MPFFRRPQFRSAELAAPPPSAAATPRARFAYSAPRKTLTRLPLEDRPQPAGSGRFTCKEPARPPPPGHSSQACHAPCSTALRRRPATA